MHDLGKNIIIPQKYSHYPFEKPPHGNFFLKITVLETASVIYSQPEQNHAFITVPCEMPRDNGWKLAYGIPE